MCFAYRLETLGGWKVGKGGGEGIGSSHGMLGRGEGGYKGGGEEEWN